MNSPTPQQQDFDVGTLYGGRYLKASDLNGKAYAATITAIEQVEFAKPGGGIQAKAVLTLQDWSAQLVLNKTNFEVLAAVYGRQAAGWIGKSIEVYPDTTFFGGHSVPCVRVRIPRPTTPANEIRSGPTPSPIAAVPTAVPPNGTGGGLPY